MGCGCTFFESATWDERIRTHVRRTWDLETTLRKLADGNPHRQIDVIADALDTRPETLAVTPIGAVLDQGGNDALQSVNLSIGAVAAAWRDEQSWLPEVCPHEALAETDRCLFHLPPSRYNAVGITPATVTDALHDALDPTDGQRTCYIGAQLETLNLAGAHIPATDSAAIDFRLARVASRVDCHDAAFGPPVIMVGAELCPGSTTTTPTTGEAANRYISVDADIDFSGATFAGAADFKRAHFHAATTFNDARFDDVAMFNEAQFSGQLELWATITGKADFSKATIAGSAQLRGTYETALICNYTQFERDVVLWNSTIQGKAEFLAAEFGGAVDCEHVTFAGMTRFCETLFHAGGDFQEAQFNDTVRFRRIRAPDAVIDLQGAHLASGTIELNNEQAHFDLAGATLGQVAIEIAPSATLPADTVAYLRFQRTDFVGFDFSGHAGAFKPEWRLDTLAASWPASALPAETDSLIKNAQLEDTYLRAKSGATTAGHNRAASEFFVHEMRARRRQHATLFQRGIRRAIVEEPSSVPAYAAAPVLGVGRAATDLLRSVMPGVDRSVSKRTETPAWQAGYRWLSNATLGMITGYGERPQRPVVASMVTVGLFAVGYWLLGVTPSSPAPLGLDYLLLSVQSFITFILGSSPVGAGFGPQLLSAFEGFIGAFLIAVFVFSLTRSIHR